jgi:hypothetical protein
VAGSGCERFETIEEAYPDYAAASTAGALGEGRWVPGLLPRSATDIRLMYYLDTNEIWLRFRFAAADLASMVSACSVLPPEQVSLARKPLVAWWPAALTRDSDRTEKTLVGFGVHGCADGILAVDRDRNEAFFWSPR